MSSELFKKGLEEGNATLLKQLPKSDRHSHSTLASPFEWIEAWAGKVMPRPPSRMREFSEMDQYLSKVLRPIYLTRQGFEFALRAAFRQAVRDGISLLEMSIDSRSLYLHPDGARGITAFSAQAHSEEAPEINFLPQIGFDRSHDSEKIRREAEAFFETGYFRSVDLYGDELAKDHSGFKWLYKMAGEAGLVLKAHAGEFGDAGSVRRAVEDLELTEVQHGIAASESTEVMQWLRNNNIRLHICPTSNLRLSRIRSMAEHPIRVLYDQGIRVSISTDDIMIFGQSVSDEYLNLFNAGVFSATELDLIRQDGLTP